MADPNAALSRRNAIQSLGLLGAGAALGSSGALEAAVQTLDDDSSEGTRTPGSLDPATRPVWMWRGLDEDRFRHYRGGGHSVRGEATVQYFGAEWDPNPGVRDEPGWRHKFVLCGSGLCGGRPRYQPVEARSLITDQSMSVTRGSVGSPTIVQNHDVDMLGFIPPNALEERILEETSSSALGEEIYRNGGVSVDQMDYFQAVEELNAEVTHLSGDRGLDAFDLANVGLIGAGIAITPLGWKAAIAIALVSAGALLVENAIEWLESEEVFLPDGFEKEISTQGSFAQMHFAAFDVLTDPGRTGDVEVQSGFATQKVSTDLTLEVEVPALPAPEPARGCVDRSLVVRDGAEPVTSWLDDTTGMVLESPGEPSVSAGTIAPNEQYRVGEEIPMEAELSENVIDHQWYASHGADDWCRVDTGGEPTSYAFEEAGEATVGILARNDAGITALETYELQIGEFEDPERGDTEGPVEISIESPSISAASADNVGYGRVELDASASEPDNVPYDWEVRVPAHDDSLPVAEDTGHVGRFELSEGEYFAELTVESEDDRDTERVDFDVPDFSFDPELRYEVEEGGGSYAGEARIHLWWDVDWPEWYNGGEKPTQWVEDVSYKAYKGSEQIDVEHGPDGAYVDAAPDTWTLNLFVDDVDGDNHIDSAYVNVTEDDAYEDSGSDDGSGGDGSGGDGGSGGDDGSGSDDPDPPTPVIDGPDSLYENETGTWNAYDSSGAEPLTYEWGGDVSGSGETVSASFACVESKSYVIELTVTDAYGQSETARHYVSVTQGDFCIE